MKKTYIGDGVYADIQNGYLILTTENGVTTTNTIYLEENVYKSLIEFVNAFEKEKFEETHPSIPANMKYYPIPLEP